MPNYNHVTLVGNLTRDVELRHIPSGTAVADIGMAINERVKKGEDWVNEPVFVDVTLWGRTAEIAQEYLRKGSPVLIDGRLKLESWNDDAGNKRSKLKVVAEKLQLLERNSGAERSSGQPKTAYDSMLEGQQRPAPVQRDRSPDYSDDGLPF